MFDVPGHASLQRVPILEPERGTRAQVGTLLEQSADVTSAPAWPRHPRLSHAARLRRAPAARAGALAAVGGVLGSGEPTG